LNPNFLDSINGIARQLTRSGLNFADAQRHALARFYTGLQAQALTLAYVDTYFVLAVAAGLMFLLSFTLRKNNLRAAVKAPVH
jgi:hypothetical protein